MSNDAAAFADAIAKFTAALDGRHDSLRNCSTSERLLSEHLANDRYYVETRDGERHAKHDFVAEEENCSRRAVGAAQMSLHRATVAIGETAPPLVALLVSVCEIELARLVQSIGDAVRDGNPGHIDQTRQEANAALRVLAAKLRVGAASLAESPHKTAPTGTQQDEGEMARSADGASMDETTTPTWEQLGGAKQTILAAMSKASEPLTNHQLAPKAGYKPGSLRKHYQKLQDWGFITSTKDGYTLTLAGRTLILAR